MVDIEVMIKDCGTLSTGLEKKMNLGTKRLTMTPNQPQKVKIYRAGGGCKNVETCNGG